LDVVGKVFADTATPNDIKPDEHQKERLDRLYDQSRIVPKKAAAKPPVGDTISKEWSFNTDGDTEGWSITKDIDKLTVKDGKLTGVSMGSDPGIITGPLDIDIDNVPYIKVGLKNTTSDAGLGIYYITDTDQNWAEDKCLRAITTVNANDYSEVLLYTGNDKKWNGKLKSIRLDPFATKGEFGIDYIRFMAGSSDGEINVKIDSTMKRFINKPFELNGRLMVPAIELFEAMGIAAGWDGYTKTVTVLNNEKVVSFQVGQNEATMDGHNLKLDQVPILENNILFIPIRAAAQVIDANLEWSEADNKIIITTKKTVLDPSKKAPVLPGVWNFNSDGDFEGWGANGDFSKPTVKDGKFTAKAIGNDPMIISADKLGLKADNYKRLRIKMKNSTSDASAAVYFITEKDGGFSEQRVMIFPTTPNSDKYIEYSLDLSTYKSWTGTIKQLRFDPTAQLGDIGIDYIILDDGVDRITGTGKNLLFDSTMESTKFSYITNGAIAHFTRDMSHTGMTSLEVEPLSQKGELLVTPHLEASEEYEFSLWTYSKYADQISLKLKYKQNGKNVENEIGKTDSKALGKWLALSGNFKLEEGPISDVQIVITNISTSREFFIDDFTIKQKIGGAK